MTLKFPDWFVMAHVNAAYITASVFLFKHPATMNFATWGTVLAAVFGVYHWLLVRDQKIPDAA